MRCIQLAPRSRFWVLRQVAQPRTRRGQRHWKRPELVLGPTDMPTREKALVSFSAVLLVALLIGQQQSSRLPGVGPNPQLPPPNPKAETKNFSEDGSWPAGATPTAPA